MESSWSKLSREATDDARENIGGVSWGALRTSAAPQNLTVLGICGGGDASQEEILPPSLWRSRSLAAFSLPSRCQSCPGQRQEARSAATQPQHLEDRSLRVSRPGLPPSSEAEKFQRVPQALDTMVKEGERSCERSKARQRSDRRIARYFSPCEQVAM